MVIGIDASRANRPVKTGTEWYSWHLIQELKKIVPTDVRVRLYTRDALQGELAALPENWEERRLGWPPKYLWTLLRLSWEMFVHPPDVLFIPAHGLPLVLPKRVVATIHDVGFERFPKLYRRRVIWYHRWVYQRALRRASSIITISEFSKREIIDVYGKLKVAISVIPNAYDTSEFNKHISEEAINFALERQQLRRPYFFFVGRLEQKKNVVRILAAFEEFQKKSSTAYSLVLAGAPGYGYEIIAREADRIGNIKILRWVPQTDVAPLMAGATAFVFPTLYEGFGIPILEAMAVGTPVITSNRGANAEVAGGGALLVDPEDIVAIAQSLLTISTDDGLKQQLREAGLNRAMHYTWGTTARQTWEILRKK